MENSNDWTKMLGAFVIGTVIGSTAGILFAPDKGSKTRKKIIGKADNITDSLREKFEDFLDNAKEDFVPKREKAGEFAENRK